MSGRQFGFKWFKSKAGRIDFSPRRIPKINQKKKHTQRKSPYATLPFTSVAHKDYNNGNIASAKQTTETPGLPRRGQSKANGRIAQEEILSPTRPRQSLFRS